MKNTNKLIVPIHKENVKQLISFMPLILGGAIIWIFILSLTCHSLNFISAGTFSTILTGVATAGGAVVAGIETASSAAAAFLFWLPIP